MLHQRQSRQPREYQLEERVARRALCRRAERGAQPVECWYCNRTKEAGVTSGQLRLAECAIFIDKPVQQWWRRVGGRVRHEAAVRMLLHCGKVTVDQLASKGKLPSVAELHAQKSAGQASRKTRQECHEGVQKGTQLVGGAHREQL